MKKLLLVLSVIALLTACGGQSPNNTPDPDPQDPDPDDGHLAAQQIAVGANSSLALGPGGVIWAWGANNLGQLGNGTLEDSSSPTQVAGLTGITHIASGNSHALAVDGEGQVWGWGHNNRGQIGVGWPSPVDAEDQYAEPQLVDLPVAAVAVGAQGYSSFALDEHGSVWAWGDNANSQLGDGTAVSRGLPEEVVFQHPEPVVVERMFVGDEHVHAVDTEGNIWYWGDAGLLTGVGTDAEAATPTLATEDAALVAFGLTRFDSSGNHALAINTEGLVYGWGSNSAGQLARDDDVYSVETPSLITGVPTGVTAVAAGGGVSVAVSGGRVFTWGTSYFGELGDGTSGGTRRNEPAGLEGLQNVVDVQAGPNVNSSYGRHVLALTDSGKVYAWGYNSRGQLATDGITESATPLLVQP